MLTHACYSSTGELGQDKFQASLHTRGWQCIAPPSLTGDLSPNWLRSRPNLFLSTSDFCLWLAARWEWTPGLFL